MKAIIKKDGSEGTMVKVETNTGKFDMVRRDMLDHYVKTGYVLAVY